MIGGGDKELISYAEDCFKKSRSERIRFEQQWYINLAFYFGKQYVQWVGASQALSSSAVWSRLVEPAAPSWRVRLVSNRIRPTIRIELSKVTKERPIGFVVPSSADDDDLLAARAGENVWDHCWRDLSMNKILRRSMFWTMLCGTAFVKDYWDKSIKDSADNDGSIVAEPVSTFHLLVPDLQEEEIENQPYVIHFMSKDPAWIKKIYGKDIQPETSGESTLLEQKIFSALGLNANKAKTTAAVKELWVKPNGKYPNGIKITWAGEILLGADEGEWPYKHKQYPFTKLDHVPTGRFYADSIIPDLIPLQKEYNRTRSQIIEAKNRMSKPQLIAPRGSVDPNKITSEPGLIIFYTPGYTPPTPLPLQNLPGYVIEELDRSIRDMDDISGQHEVAKGRTPPGVTAATAISFLQEADDTKLSYTIASLEEGVEKIGRHFLSHVDQFWDDERVIKVLGENNTLEAYMLSSSDLRGNTDFRIEVGSATPRSKSAKQAFITELMKMGTIPPDRGLRYLEMAETSRMYEEMQIDARQAQRENLKLSAGEPIGINTWDNHEVHVAEHNNHRKRQVFENLEPEKKDIIEKHVQLHQMLMFALASGLQIPGFPMVPQTPGMPPTNGSEPAMNGSTPPTPEMAAPEQGVS